MSMIASEYEQLFGLVNADTKKMVFYYWASSQKHKALFSTYAKAKKVAEELNKSGLNIKIFLI